MPNNRKFYTRLKWAVMLSAYAYLGYKLAYIAYWRELKNAFTELGFGQVLALAAVLILMPLNWAVEIKKWQALTAHVVKLPFKTAAKSVLAGLSTGFITPARVGEFAGRVAYFPENKRVIGTLLAFINGITQTLVITVFGLLAAVFYFQKFQPAGNNSFYLLIVSGLLSAGLAFFFLFPKIFEKIKTRRWAVKFGETLKSLSELKPRTLLCVLAISAARYAVFCLQYYLLLHFFKIEITPQQALSGIPTMYLLITYTPSLAASEAAIRGSAAVLVLGVFSGNEIGILLTGILIWLVNFIVPMAAGGRILLFPKKEKKF